MAPSGGSRQGEEEEDSESDSEEEEVPESEPLRTQLLPLRQELHAAAVMLQEMAGELMQAQVTQCGSACNPVK